jgi:hypothetical protein
MWEVQGVAPALITLSPHQILLSGVALRIRAQLQEAVI